MIVSYVFGACPMFIFSPKDVPAECYIGYVEGEDMFEYLDKNLSPTDIMSVSVSAEIDGADYIIRIVYNLRDEVELGMPNFKYIVKHDDSPF